MVPRRLLLLILDGISDRPCPELSGKTPLQAASTPNLDTLAREGICGIMDTIAPGIRPGSDTAHLALLGYPPERYYTGRGPLEAEGVGIRMQPGMIGFRANFATVDAAGCSSPFFSRAVRKTPLPPRRANPRSTGRSATCSTSIPAGRGRASSSSPRATSWPGSPPTPSTP